VSERSGGGVRKTSIRATTKLTLFSIFFFARRRLKSDCSDFLHRVVSDWPESKEHKLSSKLSELCIQYSNWRAGYRTRLTNILKLEEAEFERQDRERKALLMESVFDLEDDNEHELFPGHTGEIETGAGGTRSSPDRSITSRNHSSNSR